MRDWEEEFWRLAGSETQEEPGDLEGIPQLAVVDLNQFEAYSEYLELLKRREQLLLIEHQVQVNSLQSRTFLQAMSGFSLMIGVLLSVAWTIWYWVH